MPMHTAIFPGSFDPFTKGHLDILTRAVSLFDHVIIGVVRNPAKRNLFTSEERVAIIREVAASFGSQVSVESFPGLLVEFARLKGARVIVRGLRAVSDYEYEAQMALTNRHLAPNIETFFLMAREEVAYISSSVVKQVASFGGDVSGLVPALVYQRLTERFQAHPHD